MIDTLEYMSLEKKQMLIGRVHNLLKDGYSVEEIRDSLKLSEDTVRAIKRIIDAAEANRVK